VQLTLVTERVAAMLGETVHPQGAFAVVELPRPELPAALGTTPSLVAVLCGVTDPGNAGTVIRSADAAGADAVVLTAGSVDPYGGKCVRATAGSLFHLPVVTDVSIETAVSVVRERGMTVLAAVVDGEDLFTLDEVLSGPVAWLFGSEAHGLGSGAVALADTQVRVPMSDRTESLNLASAAAVCLFASARARRG
jgi:TrmH family RNA methyltransferase